jgi:hypothetical protein
MELLWTSHEAQEGAGKAKRSPVPTIRGVAF